MRLNIPVHCPRNIIQLFDLMQVLNCVRIVLLNIWNPRFCKFTLHLCFLLLCQSLWLLLYFSRAIYICFWINFIKWLWLNVTQWMDDILTSLLMSVGRYRWRIMRQCLPVTDLRCACKLVKKLRIVCALAIVLVGQTFCLFTS